MGDVSWSPGDEPPDFWLEVEDSRFAVEITQLMEAIDVGNITISVRQAIESLRKFIAGIEFEAKEKGFLDGGYVVQVFPISGFNVIQHQIKENILNFVETSASHRKESAIVWQGYRGRHWRIQRIPTEKNYIQSIVTPTPPKREYQIGSELKQFTFEALSKKAVKLESIGHPIVLLLIDAYHFADSDLWATVIDQRFPSAFHTVARVFGDYECQVLRSREDRWLRDKTTE
ncbi:MAG: hypothetical protein KC964_23685 [Candidatus Omnitrophica bacterium]|nr:hypothetical protein [Candidatus Omnitrophota bacterium]